MTQRVRRPVTHGQKPLFSPSKKNGNCCPVCGAGKRWWDVHDRMFRGTSRVRDIVFRCRYCAWEKSIRISELIKQVAK